MKAEEFFGEGLLLVIKNYGGNTVDYAVVIDDEKSYHLWKLNPYEQTYQREGIFKELKDVFFSLTLSILYNPKIEE